MISVAVKDTNEVIGFDDGTSIDVIENAIKGDLHGSISSDTPTPKEVPGRAISGFVRNNFPTFYDKVFQPAIKEYGPQPKFFQPKFDNTSERAFVTNAASTATLPLGLVGMQFHAPDAAELQQEHPIASTLGGFVGFTPAIKVMNTALKVIGAGTFLSNTVLGPSMKGLANIASKYPNLINPEMAKTIVKATAGGVQSGAVMGSLKLAGNVDTSLNTPVDEQSILDIGNGVLKDTLVWGVAGAAGASIAKPLEGLNLGQKAEQIAKEAGLTSGSLYVISKLNGDDEKDALLLAAMGGIYHVVTVAGGDFAARKWATDKAQEVVSGYIKAKNPMSEDPIPRRAAQEHAMNTAEEVIQKTKDLAEKFTKVTKEGGDLNGKSQEGQNGQEKNVLIPQGQNAETPNAPVSSTEKGKFNFPKEFTIEGHKEKHVTENGNLYPGEKFKKSLKDFKNTLNDILGWEPDLDKKGKDASVSTQYNPRNSADGHIILWKPGSDLGVYIYIQADVDQDTESANTRNRFMWRVTSKDDKYRGKSNNFASTDIAPQDLAEKINKEIEFYTAIPEPTKVDEVAKTQETTVKFIENLIEQIQPKEEKTDNQEITPKESNVSQPAEALQPKAESGIVKSEGSTASGTETNRPEQPGIVGESISGQPGDTVESAPDQEPSGVNGDVLDSTGETAAEKSPENYRIKEEDKLGEGGIKSKFSNNISAIKLLKTIESENRPATPEEQKVLVKYVGWGGMPQAFDPYNTEWEKQYSQVKELLSREEYDAARASTINAHYTSPELIKAMWRAISNMGFHKGNVLEPSSGIGHFVGLAPQEGKNFTLVELDSLSGRIAKLIYPKSSVQVKGFQEASLPSNYFGLAISNIPFSSYAPFDPRAKQQGIPSGLVLHDYFFAKALATVKPGGIVAFITSAGTLDKSGQQLKEYIDKKAKFIGSIRLPSDAFKKNANTEVVTDVIFLQKLMPGETYKNPDFKSTGEFESGDQSIFVNKYFLDNPKQVLGKMGIGSGLYSGQEMIVKNTGDFESKLADAIDRLPKDIYKDGKKEEDITAGEEIPDHTEVKQSAYVVKDGKVYQKSGEELVKQDIDGKDVKRISGLLEIRDILRDLLHKERTNAPDHEISASRKDLNRAYDKFVKSFGYMNEDDNINSISDDPDAPLLASLEKVDKVNKKWVYKKREIFDQRLIKPHIKPTKAANYSEALKISLGEYGEPNWKYIEQLLEEQAPNIQQNMLSEGLIFRDPDGDKIVIKDEYLSGNVKKKLADAKAASENDPSFNKNVEELSKVIPADRTFDKIRVNIGMPWIKGTTYSQFMRSLGMSAKVILNKATGTWAVEKGGYSYGGMQEWGVGSTSGEKIFEKVLNGRPVKIMKKVVGDNGEEKSIIDEELSAVAEEKATLMKEKFKTWFWEDDARREEYEKIYNEGWNNTVTRKYDGSHLVFPGMNNSGLPGPLRSSQLNAIWRTITSKRVMLAHSVGAGKTAIMTISAMESKRLGLSNKSLISAPKNTIPSWRNHINGLYPGAKVLVANEKNFDSKKLKSFLARVATGDWDIVVMSHDNLEKLKVSPETYKKYVEEQISDLRDAKDEAKASGSRITVKNIETAIHGLEAKLAEALDQTKKLDILSFEELGIDALYVDEADLFKNLAYSTTKQGIKGMGNPTGSVGAMDLKMKSDIIRGLNGKIVFATGTPISNSMVEAYTMMKYLQPEMLQEQGIKSFDGWANTFADPSTESEVDVTGARYKLVTRFKNFMNMSALRTMIGEVWDIQTQKMLIESGVLKRGVNLPMIKGGKAQNVIMPTSLELDDYTATLIERAEEIKNRKRPPEKGDDIMLTVMMDGINAALDMRMIDPTLPANPNSKVEYTIRGVLEKYKEYEKNKGTQIIFIDKPAPDPKSAWNPQIYMKKQLIEGGIPAKEIAFIHDFNTESEKSDLYRKMNDGEIRVLFGSTEKLGAGTNIQERLAVLWHLGIPTNYRPRDIVQREGRIDRPGNTNKEVEIYRLAQKGSLDTFIYQLLEAKSKTVEQFMKGDQDMIDMNEDDVDPYEAMKALSSNNPLLKEKADIDREVRKLQSLYNGYLSERNKASKVSKEYGPLIEAKSKELAAYENFKNNLPVKPTKENFTIKVGDQVYKDKAEAHKAIYEKLGTLPVNSAKAEAIGEYLGYPLVANKVVVLDRVENSIGVEISKSPTAYLWGKVSQDPVGTFGSLDNGIFNDVDRYISRLQERVTEDKKSLTYANELLSGSFSKRQELDDKIKRQKEIEAELRTDKSKEGPGLSGESGQISTAWLNGTAEVVQEIVNVIAPKVGVDSKALDEIYKAKGGKDKTEFELEVQMKEFRDMFDKMSKEDTVSFIDRIKRGEDQPTPLLQAIADMMRRIEDAYYTQVTEFNPESVWKENHYRVLWKVIPGQQEKQGFKGIFRRPLQGTKGFFKKSTLADMSEGLALGGVPYSYNPMVMWQIAIMDMQAYITAQRMFKSMKNMGMVRFVKMGGDVPEGFVRINDSIAKKYFKVEEGLVNAGEYWIEENVGRVLNNYLSTDYIRNSAIGRNLLAFKNITTSLELSLSTFHAMYESGAAIASKIGLGVQKMLNRGSLIDGLKDIALSGTAPGQFTATGGRAIKYVTNADEFIKSLEGQEFIKQFPDAADLINDAFMGGMKFAIHQDYKTNSLRSLKEGINNREPWAITMNALPGLNEALMKPMFEWFIPRLKLGAFLTEMQEAILSHKQELESGKISRSELARIIVDSVENRFGEMNFDNLFWDRNFKTAMQLVIRSVTWKYGALKNVAGAIPAQIKEFSDAYKDGRKPKIDNNMAYLFGVAIMVVTLSAIIQKLYTGLWPESWKDTFAPRYDKNSDRIMLNTHLKDWIHIIHSPAGFVQSSMTGEIGKMLDLWENKDFYGTEIHHADDPALQQAFDIAKHLFPVPFSISQYSKISESDAPIELRASTALGITQPVPKYISSSPAEQKAYEIAQENRTVGSRTKEETQKSDVRRKLSIDYKESGSIQGLDKALGENRISRKEYNDIIKNAKLSNLQRSTVHMSAEEVSKVMEKADDKELKELVPIFKKKIDNKIDSSDEFEAKKLRELKKVVLKKFSR